MPDQRRGIVGILLAAGSGSRFDPTGMRNKLLQVLPDGAPVAVAAARNLLAAVPEVLAVVRPGAAELAGHLRNAGCEVMECETAAAGMSQSLVLAVSRSMDASGWVIGLGDMPFIQPATVVRLVEAVQAGAGIAVPFCAGRRGNPVAFSRIHVTRLLQLQGDQGARSLLQSFPVTEVVVDDHGIFRDIDRPGDLPAKPGPADIEAPLAGPGHPL